MVRARMKLFEILGGQKCVCPGSECWHAGLCIVTDMRCLQFDHINGKGSEKRRLIGKRSFAYYEYYAANPALAKKELQVYCANCNWVKRSRLDEVAHPFLKVDADGKERGWSKFYPWL